MRIDHQHHLLHPRTRFTLARMAEAVTGWLFDEIAWISAGCHLANSMGFDADEELVQRYLSVPGWNDTTQPTKSAQVNLRGEQH